jgi:hypothetical protein
VPVRTHHSRYLPINLALSKMLNPCNWQGCFTIQFAHGRHRVRKKLFSSPFLTDLETDLEAANNHFALPY